MWTTVSSFKKSCHKHPKQGRDGEWKVSKQTPFLDHLLYPTFDEMLWLFEGNHPKFSFGLSGRVPVISPERFGSRISQSFEILSHVWSMSSVLYRSSGQLRLWFGRLSSNSFHGKNQTVKNSWKPHSHHVWLQCKFSESFCLLHCPITMVVWSVNVLFSP